MGNVKLTPDDTQAKRLKHFIKEKSKHFHGTIIINEV